MTRIRVIAAHGLGEHPKDAVVEYEDRRAQLVIQAGYAVAVEAATDDPVRSKRKKKE